MGRIVRYGGQAFEVVDEGKKIVTEANFGASVISEFEVVFPIVFKMAVKVSFAIQSLLTNMLRKLRDVLAPKEELEVLHEKDAELDARRKEPNTNGSTIAVFFSTLTSVNVGGLSLIIQIGKYAFLRSKGLVQKIKEKSSKQK